MNLAGPRATSTTCADSGKSGNLWVNFLHRLSHSGAFVELLVPPAPQFIPGRPPMDPGFTEGPSRRSKCASLGVLIAGLVASLANYEVWS